MQQLKDKIAREGKNLGRGILKVDSFVNHQVEPALMMEIGKALADRFRSHNPTKVLTAEVSGIAPAIFTAYNLAIPVIYARKIKPITMPSGAYARNVPSHTKGHMTQLLVSPEVLSPGERVLIVDDFLASGQTLQALASIVEESGSQLAGIGVIIEKSFEEGRKTLSPLGVPVESLVVIKEMTEDAIIFG
jgi:xanthine phosphoribosyltransferase